MTKTDVRPVPKLTDLVNENGDIVYRPPFTTWPVIIKKAEIEQYLDGRPLDNTNIWEVIRFYHDQKIGTLSKPDQALPTQ